MDIDPLAESPAPRHAIESDEEEDEYNPLHTQPVTHCAPLDIQIVGNIASVPSLVIATGSVAKYWARGADLGEQVATVAVDKIQVGLLFRPAWTQAAVLVSEVSTRLPLWAMRAYTRAVLGAIKPTDVALLDAYAASVYISDARTTFVDAPLRYLSTSAPSTTLSSAAQPFATPNLVQSTSAAFVAHRAEQSASATLLLVPAPHITPPAPRELSSSDYSLSGDTTSWSSAHVRTAHALLFAELGEQVASTWKEPPAEKPTAGRARKRPIDTDIGMYI
ncbi:membrane-bound transcription factor site-2 protease-like protein [Favolaschia claudopus]|uniref:Membrane-bound transcription factor site-2 protease-like protein n=1 Tax=Favolaschia claudopus TaxID=2862362 RepID=A0AAW0D216_9AGAR